MKRVIVTSITIGGVLIAFGARAQDEGGEAGGGAPPPVDVTVVQQPGPAQTVYGPPPGGEISDINKYLPSSSSASTDISSSQDGFDLNRPASGGQSVYGGKDAAYVVQGQYVPDLHTAKRGDTLWDISKKYYGNPYNWPRVWSYNQQIQNPHWIYPGDQIKLRGGYGVRTVGGFVRAAPVVPPNTVFQRHVGYVQDGEIEVWGRIVGSPEDQMLLSEGDEIYIQLNDFDEHPVQVGDFLTLFEPRKVKGLTPHPLVWIRGRAKANRVNPKTGMVRARITESLLTIERGVRVGPDDRKIDVVQPVRNAKTVEARITGALYPFEFYGQNQVVFINRGEEDGVEVGNRFFAVSRGDEWRLGLDNAGNLADKRALTEDDRFAEIESTPDEEDPELYPAETYAELIVLRTREKTATCLVTASIREIARGAIVIMREGY